jgi:hypothetical protein
MSAKASLSFDIYLRATPQQIRAVLADTRLVPCWLVGVQFQPDREEATRRLTCEWLQTDHLDTNGGSPSVVRFESVAMGRVTRLRVTHQDLAPGGGFLNLVASGWPIILSSLKSLIETGNPLDFGLVHQVVPGLFGQVDVVVGGGTADVLEGQRAVGVGHVLHLVETGQRVAHVAG